MSKYRKSTNQEITDSRLRLKNQYAYLNDEGCFEAITSMQEPSQDITNSRFLLQNQYAHLNDKGGFDAATSKQKTSNPERPTNSNSNNKASISYEYIEQKVRELQINMWNKRHELWPEGIPLDPVDLLDPRIAIELSGFNLEMQEYLGEFYAHSKSVETAGILDRTANRISISNRMPENSLRFTTAHELGHALLHNDTLIHRDVPIDGSSNKNHRRERIEIEADKFATYFLMPEKLVKKRFHQQFGVDKFILDENTAFALDPKDPFGLLQKCKTPHELAKTLAKAVYYNGEHLNSLATQFRVSGQAMAIRIEELNLIQV